MAKRRHKKKLLPVRNSVMATKERRRQNGGVTEEVADRDYTGKIYIKRHRACSECVVDAYLYYHKITETEHEAAMRFRRAYLRAVLGVRVEDQGSGSHGDPDMALFINIKSEQILREAYSVLSPAQKTIILRVCGDDKSAGDTYRFETFQRAVRQLIKLWKLG